MTRLLLIGTGGFLGTLSRYALGGLVYRLLSDPWLPWGTLACNLLGCLAIGFLGGLGEFRQFWNPQFRLLILIGFLGGFTTFSTFGYETFGLIRTGQFFAALCNVGVSCILGLTLVWVGWNLSRIV
ncbi:MAG TPA: fluoride efflux transporter CrcB [bacterium]|nr:fluoride efflux transporter CrcB [bacterium]